MKNEEKGEITVARYEDRQKNRGEKISVGGRWSLRKAERNTKKKLRKVGRNACKEGRKRTIGRGREVMKSRWSLTVFPFPCHP